MEFTINDARELYAQGGKAKEIALRKYTEAEILNDYTKITELPKIVEYTEITDLYAQLYTVYKSISEGRPVDLTRHTYYRPCIIFSDKNYKFKNRGGNTYKGRVKIDDTEYNLYIGYQYTTYEGRLGFENDGVYCGCGLLNNKWVFRDELQAIHFVNYFYKDLIRLELCDTYNIKFIDNDTEN